MILDGHVHIRTEEVEGAKLAGRFREAGVDGAALISLPPAARKYRIRWSFKKRLDQLMAWCATGQHLYPLFWIDPTEADAPRQVAAAVARGVSGFKVICSVHEPGHPRALVTYREIAAAKKPILFHSGILWDGQPSSPHNRPAAFEALLEVPYLRFALAHISWPWCDECVAVYGKFLNTLSIEEQPWQEMFVDITPGTPPLYREEALRKLFCVGYDVEQNVFFGSDSTAHDYNVKWVREWLDRDEKIMKALGVSIATIARVRGGNLRRFVGLDTSDHRRKAVEPGM